MRVRRGRRLLARGAPRLLAGLVFAAGALAVLGPTGAVGGGGAWAQEGSDVATRRVVIRGGSIEDGAAPVVVDRLAPQTVLVVEASGFAPDTTGRVVQCVNGSSCGNSLAVRFDEDGFARFQYLVTDDTGGPPGSGRCRLGEPRCTIELRVGEATSVVDTVFVDDAPPPGELGVDPRTDLMVGDTITVTADGFDPGAELTLLVCAAPSTGGSRCGAPGPVVPLTVDAGGSADATITVPPEVGADRVACGRRSLCRVVVSSDEVGAWARPVALSFAAAPGADYDPTRVVVGLAIALGLGAGAVWLIRSTDWQPPPEADGSAIDDAEYADLDLEAELFVDPAGPEGPESEAPSSLRRPSVR